MINLNIPKQSPPSAGNGCGMIVVSILVLIMIAGSCGGGPKTNLHREALDKLDRRERLTPAEEKRIHDILHFKEKK